MALRSTVPTSDRASRFRPAAPPQIISESYTDDQYRRLIDVVRRNGPWELILAQNFASPEEVIATTSGSVPEGMTVTWDMLLNPVFRGYLGRQGLPLYPEIEDCYFNFKFLDLVRKYWNTDYAEPEAFLFNLQGATPVGGPPHLDGTAFRGLTPEDSPLWLLLTMAKSGLFERWRIKKAQVIAWYYKGRIGGGFNCWPNGPQGEPLQIERPLWGKAVVVENEMMYHHGQAAGPVAKRKPQGLAINSLIQADPDDPEGWLITTGGKVIQTVPADEARFLVHWGARVYRDYDEVKVTLDRTDEITREQALGMLMDDMRKSGLQFKTPSDPMHDKAFITLLSQAYDLGVPTNIPADELEERVAA